MTCRRAHIRIGSLGARRSPSLDHLRHRRKREVGGHHRTRGAAAELRRQSRGASKLRRDRRKNLVSEYRPPKGEGEICRLVVDASHAAPTNSTLRVLEVLLAILLIPQIAAGRGETKAHRIFGAIVAP